MASIEETKDALEVQRQVAAQVTERSLSAINDVVALSSHTITAISVIAGFIAIVGGVAIYVAAKDAARKIANRRMDAYIKSDEGRAAVQQAVQEEVRRNLQERFVMVVQPDTAAQQPSSFSNAPDDARGTT